MTSPARIGRAATWLLILSLSSSQVLGQAGQCWAPQEVGAARISEFQMMLMGASLRCNSKGVDFTDDYSRFVIAHKTMLDTAESRLKTHFGIVPGQKKRNAFDSYMIGLANFYGTGKTTVDTCQQFGIIARELAKVGDGGNMLATLAMQMVRDPRIDGPRCGKPTGTR